MWAHVSSGEEGGYNFGDRRTDLICAARPGAASADRQLGCRSRTASNAQPAAAADSHPDAAGDGGGHAGHGRDDGAVVQWRTESDDVDVSHDDAGQHGDDV